MSGYTVTVRKSRSLSKERAASLLAPPRDFTSTTREKSPFEIGAKPDVVVASSKAIIDKASVMDISGGVTNIDEYVNLLFTDFCALDKASCADISEVKIVIVEEDEEEALKEQEAAEQAAKEAAEQAKETTTTTEDDSQAEGMEGLSKEERRKRRKERRAGKVESAESEKESTAKEEEKESEEEEEEDEETSEEGTGEEATGEEVEGEEEAEEEEEQEEKEPTPPPKKEPTPPPPKEPSLPPVDPDEGLDELMPPEDVFGDASVWEQASDDIVAGAPKVETTEEIEAPPSVKEEPIKPMTEREKDLEWSRQRALMRPPLIVTHLKDRAGPIGSTVKLTCSVTGPDLAVRWLRNGTQVDFKPYKYKFNVSEALLSMEIHDLEMADDAEYACVVRNKNGETSTICRVRVYESFDVLPVPPTFISMKDEQEKEHYPTLKELREKLEFNVHLKDRTVVEGESLKLFCSCTGSTPEFKWYKGTRELSFDTRIRNIGEPKDGFACIEFVRVLEEDSGQYSCYARTAAERMYTTCSMKVIKKVEYKRHDDTMAPVFVRSVKETFNRKEHTLTFETMILANPSPKVQWFKGPIRINYPIEDPDIVIYTHPDEVGKHTVASLTFYKPTFADNGKYTCVAENECGTAKYTHDCNFITEDEFYEWKAAEITEREKLKQFGKPSKVEKKLAGKADKKIAEVYKPPPLTAEELAIKMSDVYYRHIYEAKKRKEEEALALERAKEPEILPYNTDAEFITKPFCVVTHLLNQTVLEGKDIKLTWVVKAFDNLEATWTKDGKFIQFGRRVLSDLSDDGRITLEIHHAQLSDSGKYRCTVKSKKYGNVTQECHVTVFKIDSTEIPPTFTRLIREIYYPHKDELFLDCHVNGEPKPKIEWLRNGLFIKNSEKFFIKSLEDGTCELHILGPKRSDSGKYVIRASNSSGTSELEHVINWKCTDEDLVEEFVAKPKDDKELKKLFKSKYIKEADWECYGSSYRSHRKKQEEIDPKKKLKFITHLKDQCVPTGHVLTLKCFVDGSYPSYIWYKEDIPLLHGKKYYMKIKKDGMVELDVRDVQLKDAGNYRLVCKNYTGEIETSAKITVFDNPFQKVEPPVFCGTISESYSMNKNELMLECRVRGTPKPHISWIKDGEYVVPGDKYEQYETTDGTCKLIICKPDENDCGTYTCEASAGGCSDTISHNVQFDRQLYTLERSHGFKHLDLNKPRFLLGLTDNTVPSGGNIVLIVESPNNPECHWYRDGKQLKAHPPKINIFEDNDCFALVVTHATMDESAKYVCRLTNTFGSTESHSYVDVINPNSVGKGQRPPTFHTRPQTQIKIRDGDLLSMSFKVIGEPKPKTTCQRRTPVRSFTPIKAFTPTRLPPITRFYPTSAPIESRSRAWYRSHPISPIGPISPFLDQTSNFNLTYTRRGTLPTLKYDPILDPVWEGEYKVQRYRPRPLPEHRSRSTTFDIERYPLHKFSSYLGKPTTLAQIRPYLTKELRNTQIELSQPAQLKCHAIGGAVAGSKIRWYKNGVEIKQDGRLTLFNASNTSVLDISRTSLKDSGLYRAVVENELGSTSYYCMLTVTKRTTSVMYNELSLSSEMEYMFKEGEIIRVITRLPTNIIENELVLFHNGIRKTCAGRTTLVCDRSGFIKLIIFNANKGDSGQYNISTKAGTTVRSFRVNVVSKRPALEFDYKETGRRYGALVQDDYKVDTTFFTPKEHGKFDRDTRSIEKSSIKFSGKEIPQATLLIPFAKLDCYDDCAVVSTTTVTKRSSSPYTSYAGLGSRSKYGLNMSTTTIAPTISLRKSSSSTIETAPYFMKHLRDVRCYTHEEVQLNCMVEGVPLPMISWEKDGRQINSGQKCTIEYRDRYCSLIIHNTQTEDSGEYFCIANNSMGRVRTSAYVTVIDKENSRYQLSRVRTPFLNLTPIRSTTPIHSNQSTYSAPKFFSVPHNKVVEEGADVTFQCVVSGIPAPWSTWDKDGIILSSSSHIFIKEKNDIKTLDIQNVTMRDSGLYRITIENDYGRSESSFRLDVISTKPGNKNETSVRNGNGTGGKLFRYTRRIISNPAASGRLVFKTLYNSSAEPHIKFYHNGALLKESDRVNFRIEKSCITLEVKNPKADDAGEYLLESEVDGDIYCTITSVSNNFLKNTECKDIQSSPTIIQHLPKHHNFLEGSPIDLKFEIKSDSFYEYKWFKEDNLIIDSDDFQYIDFQNGVINLRIKDPFTQDSGKYSCVIANEFGTATTSTQLLINESNEYSPKIGFVHALKNQICTFGDVVSFYAMVMPPNAVTKWYVQGKDIMETSNEYMIEDGTDGSRILHILGTEYTHNGDVTCLIYVESKHDIRQISHANLAVLPVNLMRDNSYEGNDCSPRFLQGPCDGTALVGSTVTLEAYYRGNPEPDIKWMRGGQIINDNNARIIKTYGFSKLLIQNITSDQSGKYTIEITNPLGTDIMSTSLGIETQPDPPSSAPYVSPGPDRIAIAWCGSPYDGGCMVTEYILEVQDETGEWSELTVIKDSLAYTAKNLNPGSKYQFRVRAVNRHGPSRPSESSEPVLMEAVEEEEEEEYKQVDVYVEHGGSFTERFDVLEEMGKGRFGHVHKIIERSSGQILAAKFVKCIKLKDKEKVMEEINIMKALRHPKLLQLATHFEENREVIMITECITGGELFERVVADDFTLTEWDCILFMRQICEGVEYMHSKFIVHLDLKPENVMCYTKNSHQIKIIDFGLAQKLKQDTPVRVLFGTPEFIPPEIINYEPIGLQSDMWSVGVICYVLLSGLSPFMGDSDSDTFSNILRADYDFNDEAFDEVSQDAKDFIASLLIRNKEERTLASGCLKSKWLSKNDRDGAKVLSTDKLKKFIVRRKWQKTGNAIRALGRMVNLSASRRSSSISTTPANFTPRPSISNNGLHSLDEGSYEKPKELVENIVDVTEDTAESKILKHVNFNDRSDSGFHEVEEKRDFMDMNIGSRLKSQGDVVAPQILKEKLKKIIEDGKEGKIEINNLSSSNENEENTHKSEKKVTRKISSLQVIIGENNNQDVNIMNTVESRNINKQDDGSLINLTELATNVESNYFNRESLESNLFSAMESEKETVKNLTTNHILKKSKDDHKQGTFQKEADVKTEKKIACTSPNEHKTSRIKSLQQTFTQTNKNELKNSEDSSNILVRNNLNISSIKSKFDSKITDTSRKNQFNGNSRYSSPLEINQAKSVEDKQSKESKLEKQSGLYLSKADDSVTFQAEKSMSKLQGQMKLNQAKNAYLNKTEMVVKNLTHTENPHIQSQEDSKLEKINETKIKTAQMNSTFLEKTNFELKKKPKSKDDKIEITVSRSEKVDLQKDSKLDQIKSSYLSKTEESSKMFTNAPKHDHEPLKESKLDKIRNSYLSKTKESHKPVTQKSITKPFFLSEIRPYVKDVLKLKEYHEDPTHFSHTTTPVGKLVTPMEPTQTTFRNANSAKQLNIQISNKTALLRQRFEQVAEQHDQDKLVRNFRTK